MKNLPDMLVKFHVWLCSLVEQKISEKRDFKPVKAWQNNVNLEYGRPNANKGIKSLIKYFGVNQNKPIVV